MDEIATLRELVECHDTISEAALLDLLGKIIVSELRARGSRSLELTQS